MSLAGAAPCAHVRTIWVQSRGTWKRSFDETQAAVEPAGKKRKEGKVSKELMAAAAQIAVDNVMNGIQSRQTLIEEMNGSVERAVGAVMQKHWDIFRKWESKIVQLEPESVEVLFPWPNIASGRVFKATWRNCGLPEWRKTRSC